MKSLIILIFGASSLMGAVFNTPDKMLARYFPETDRLAADSLAGVKTLGGNARKDRYRRKCMKCWVWIRPLNARLSRQQSPASLIMNFEVWKLHYQSIPRLYVTANLYVPKGLKKPAPAILYFVVMAR